MYLFYFIIKNILINRFLFEGQIIEIIWTVLPIILLIYLVIPSLKILYLTDEIINPYLTVKVLGHQWYWSYEYSDFINLNFDSFIEKNFDNKIFRLLDVDNRIILPINLNLRILLSSLDVIHSFTVPSIGVKVDCVPGRLNQININLNRPGLFYGQCSEICGVNHRFMPIVIERNSIDNFLEWIRFKI